MGIARAPCDDLSIVVRGPYDYLKSLQSSYDFFFPNDHLKSCVFCTISAQPLCGVSAGFVRCYLRRVYVLRACDILNFVMVLS